MNKKAKEILRIQGRIDRLLKEETFLLRKGERDNSDNYRLRTIGIEKKKLQEKKRELESDIVFALTS